MEKILTPGPCHSCRISAPVRVNIDGALACDHCALRLADLIERDARTVRRAEMTTAEWMRESTPRDWDGQRSAADYGRDGHLLPSIVRAIEIRRALLALPNEEGEPKPYRYRSRPGPWSSRASGAPGVTLAEHLPRAPLTGCAWAGTGGPFRRMMMEDDMNTRERELGMVAILAAISAGGRNVGVDRLISGVIAVALGADGSRGNAVAIARTTLASLVAALGVIGVREIVDEIEAAEVLCAVEAVRATEEGAEAFPDAGPPGWCGACYHDPCLCAQVAAAGSEA